MSDLDLKGRTLGDFVVGEKIAQGGYGTVYRCEQPVLQRHVVIKVLRRRGAAAEERFLQEAKLASKLDHPNAAHIYAFGIDEEIGFWIAMELVPGVTLEDWLKAHGPIPWEQFVPFFADLADVVQFLHERGIVHRDLKPANLMVIVRAGRLIPKLLDLGIAREGIYPETIPDDSLGDGDSLGGDDSLSGGSLSDDSLADDSLAEPPELDTLPDTDGRTTPEVTKLTPPGANLGSLLYMPPEQWDNPGTVGPAADIYALGVIAYEALKGKVPFSSNSPGELRAKHLYDRVPSLGFDFSPEVNQVVRRALAKEWRFRQHSAQELGAELGAALRALPRGQIRSLAQVWHDGGRSSALLLKGGDLLHVETGLGSLEREFLAASRRHAARGAYLRSFLAAALAAFAVFAVWQRGEYKTEMAEQQRHSAQEITEATITLADRERGRAALLSGDPKAAIHLVKAYQRDHAPTTAFMLARALQSRLAEQARFPSSFGRMWSAELSPDSKQLVVADDKNAQVWDAQSYRLLFTLPHGDTVYHAVYNSDGSRIITAGSDGAVRTWDAAKGKLVRELRHDGRQLRYRAVVLHDDKWVAAIDVEGAVAHVWDASTGAFLAELRNDASGFPSVAFSFDGRWLAASGGADVRVFDTRTWMQVLTIPSVRRLSWDPQGHRLLTGSGDGDVSLWEIPSGTRIHHLRQIGEPVDAVAISPDSRLLVAASRDGASQVWDASSGKLRSQGNYLHSAIRSVEFDPSSTFIVAAGGSGSVAIADAARGMLISGLEASRNPIVAAHFAPGSSRVITASSDGIARIWDGAPPYRRWSSLPIADDCGVATGLEPDRRFVAVGCGDRPTRIWDTARDQLVAELPSVTPVADDFASALPAVSGAGDRAAIARGSIVEVYELPGGKLEYTVRHDAAVNAVAFATTGHALVSGATDGSLLVTQDNGAQLALPRSSAGIDVAGFLPDGRLVAADARRRLRVYDARGTLLAELEMTARSKALRMSPDSRRLLSLPRFVGKVASPELWDVEHYRVISQLDDQGQGRVFSARFVAEGQVITACGDGVARLWDSSTGQLRQTYVGGARFIAEATLSPEGSMIVGGDGDGVLRFWDAVSGLPLWTMQAHRSHLIGIRMDGENVVTRGFSGDVARWTLPKPERVIEACGNNERCATVFK